MPGRARAPCVRDAYGVGFLGRRVDLPARGRRRGDRGRGRWAWRRSGVASGSTAPGTPRTGWRSGPAPMPAPTSSGRCCLSSEVRRTMSVVMEPLGPIEASRKVEQARTADIADAELRRRGGFLATARRRREEEILVRREVELADGHAQYRFSGYVTVSARRSRRARGGVRAGRAGRRTGRARAAAVLRGPGQHLHCARFPSVAASAEPAGMGIPAHEATTRHLGAAVPVPVASRGSMGWRGVLVGRDLLGAAFAYDPFELYRRGHLTNPNMVVIGQIGRGKSAFVKTYLWRLAVFGRRAWVVDPKGEYGALARGLGRRAGGACARGARSGSTLSTPCRRPRRPEPTTRTWRRQRGELLASLSAASLGRPLLPTERSALDLAVAGASPPTSTGRARRGAGPTLPEVVDALLRPDRRSARAVGTDVAGAGRRRTQRGAGAPSTGGRRPAGHVRRAHVDRASASTRPLVVLDLSAVYHSAALGILMTCATAWLQAGLGRLAADRDRPAWSSWWTRRGRFSPTWAWRAGSSRRGSCRGPGACRTSPCSTGCRTSTRRARPGPSRSAWPRACWRTPRPASSTPSHRARSNGPRALLGLSSTEAELVPHLRRGVALWKVGSRSFLVQHRLSPLETGHHRHRRPHGRPRRSRSADVAGRRCRRGTRARRGGRCAAAADGGVARRGRLAGARPRGASARRRAAARAHVGRRSRRACAFGRRAGVPSSAGALGHPTRRAHPGRRQRRAPDG